MVDRVSRSEKSSSESCRKTSSPSAFSALFPFDEFFYTCLEIDRRIIAEKLSGFFDRGPGTGNIPRLIRLAILFCRFPESVFNGLNHFKQRHCRVVTEIENFIWRLLVSDSSENSRHGVVHISVIATRRSIAEKRDRFALQHQIREFVNR